MYASAEEPLHASRRRWGRAVTGGLAAAVLGLFACSGAISGSNNGPAPGGTGMPLPPGTGPNPTATGQGMPLPPNVPARPGTRGV